VCLLPSELLFCDNKQEQREYNKNGYTEEKHQFPHKAVNSDESSIISS
jgi:hypothetical protein